MEVPGTLLRRYEIRLIATLLLQKYHRIPKADEFQELQWRWDALKTIYFFACRVWWISCRHCDLKHGSETVRGMYWAIYYQPVGGPYLHLLCIGAECLEHVLSTCRAWVTREAFGLCRTHGAFEICRDLFERVCYHVYEIEIACIQ
jgi:hypothetical protein